MKWVPMSPLVLAPQIAKPPTRSQKVPVRDALRRAPTARAAAPCPGAGGGSTSVPPYGGRPTSLGWSRSSQSTSGTTTSAAPVTVSAAVRQPCVVASAASRGRKINCPVAPAAVRTPVMMPRRAMNQRPVTVATKARAIDPVPSPTSTPQHRMSCQLDRMNTVSPLPAATRVSATATTRRMPKRSISAAANGAVRPNSSRLTETATDIVPRDQPNSCCSGVINTPGVARNPAAPTIATNDTTATHQARCTRLFTSTRVTGPSCGYSGRSTSGPNANM
jgi:hypothetical protein